MVSDRLARVWFGLTAAVALAGLVIQLVVTAGATGGQFPTAAARVANLFCFFTIQSNVLVLLTCALLAVRLDRPATLFRVLRADTVLAITVTGVVYHVALAGLHELTGFAAVADFLLHTATPVLTLLGWLLLGPRGSFTARTIPLAVIFPVAWLVFTLVRGPIVHFYPYPFVDVTTLGLPRVLVNCAIVAVLFLALAGGAALLDKRLPVAVRGA